MSFQAPLFLLALAAIPAALFALLIARKRPAKYVVRFPATATLAAVAGRTGRARRARPVFPTTAASVAVAGKRMTYFAGRRRAAHSASSARGIATRPTRKIGA